MFLVVELREYPQSELNGDRWNGELGLGSTRSINRQRRSAFKLSEACGRFRSIDPVRIKFSGRGLST